MLHQALPARQVATETVEEACEDAIWARMKEGLRRKDVEGEELEPEPWLLTNFPAIWSFGAARRCRNL